MSAKVKLLGEGRVCKSAVATLTHTLPFVQNKRGILIHRPRYVNIYNLHKQAHMAVSHLCGNGTTGPVTANSHIKFLATPPDDSVMCERCEEFAAIFGLPSASELAGRHVHRGKLKAVITCCEAKP